MSSNTLVTLRDDQAEFDAAQLAMLRNLGVERAGREDLAIFFHVSKRTGLDPFARQIYLVERQGKQVIQTGIDGYRLIAQRVTERTKGTFGYEDTQWCGTDGVWRDVWIGQEPPSAARVTVVRNGQRFPGIAIWDEYVQTKRDGSVTQMWKTRPAGQLAKCAEALALRKAFPQDLSGVYTDDEMQHADNAGRAPQAAPRVSAADFATPAAEPAVDTTTGEVIEEQA